MGGSYSNAPLGVTAEEGARRGRWRPARKMAPAATPIVEQTLVLVAFEVRVLKAGRPALAVP